MRLGIVDLDVVLLFLQTPVLRFNHLQTDVAPAVTGTVRTQAQLGPIAPSRRNIAPGVDLYQTVRGFVVATAVVVLFGRSAMNVFVAALSIRIVSVTCAVEVSDLQRTVWPEGVGTPLVHDLH